MRRLRVLLATSLVGVIALGDPIAAAARVVPATVTSRATVRSFVTPIEDRFLDECSDAEDTGCIVSVDIRPVGTSDFVAADESIMVAVTFEPSDLGRNSWSLWVHPADRPGALELAPEIPAGTSFRILVNSGDVAPAGHMWSFARNVTWTRTHEADGDWLQFFEFTATPRSDFEANCSVGCASVDRESVAHLEMAELTAVKSEPELSALSGSIVAGNYNLAPTIIDPDAQTITWWGVGPSTTAAGDPNIGWVEGFIPNALLRLFFGLDAQGIVDSSGITVRAGEASGDPVASTMTVVPGGLRIEVEGFRVREQQSSRPGTAGRVQGGQFVLRAKRMAAAPTNVTVRGGTRRAVVKADAVRKVRGYQAMCYQKSKRVYRSGDTPRIVVKNLSPGRWRCQIRAMRTTGGYWSRTVRTNVLSNG